MIINSVAPIREERPKKKTGSRVNSVGKAGRAFEKPAMVVGGMPTAKKVPGHYSSYSRRHLEPRKTTLYRSSAVPSARRGAPRSRAQTKCSFITTSFSSVQNIRTCSTVYSAATAQPPTKTSLAR